MDTKLFLQHPTFSNAQEIATICAPLKKLNITYFAHVRITLEKKFSTISTNPAFAAHYLQNKYFAIDIHMADQKRFGNFFVWDSIEFSDQLCAEASSLGVNNPFTIIKQEPDAMNYYHFANHSQNKQINQVYIANLDLLELFIDHFNEKIKQSNSLSRAYDFTIDLNSYLPIALEDPDIFYDRTEFLKNFKNEPLKVMSDSKTTLSKRQYDVLQWVLCGKTIKEIAKILGLSERTVGHYFEAIKIKLNVATRSELISRVINPSLLLKLTNG